MLARHGWEANRVIVQQVIEGAPLQKGCHQQQVPGGWVHGGAHHGHYVGVPQPQSHHSLL